MNTNLLDETCYGTMKSWPNLFGVNVTRASELLRQNYPQYTIVPVQERTIVTDDIDTSRVFVWYDTGYNVSRIPRNG